MTASVATPQDTATPRFSGGRRPAWLIPVVALASVLAGAGLSLGLNREFSVSAFVVFGVITYVAGMFIGTWAFAGRRKATDQLWKNLVWAALGLALIPLISLLYSVLRLGLPALITDPGIFTTDMSGVVGASDQATQAGEASLAGGILHGLVGTLLITLSATAISVPVGILASIYLVEYAKNTWFSRAIRFFVDVMTGIPSIVAGLFAFAMLTLVVQLVFGSNPIYLQSVKTGFTAALALSVLMIPVVVRSTEEMLNVVSDELREASYALGVPKWRTIMQVVLPTSVSGIASGVTLAIARVAGETAPILVTAGFATTINWNVFDGWMTALPVFIYRQLTNPTAPAAADPSTARAWAAALVLIGVVMALNLSARLIAQAFAPKATA